MVNSAAAAMMPRMSVMVPSPPTALRLSARKVTHGPILPTTMPTAAIIATIRLGRYNGAAVAWAGPSACAGMKKV